MEFDYVLKKIGEFDTFQYILCFYAICASLLNGVPHLSQIMLNVTPDHWCNVPELSGFAMTETEKKYISIPRGGDESSYYSQCKMYDFNYSSILGTNSTAEMFDQINSRTASTVSCKNGWNFDKSNQYNSLVTEHQWICENGWKDTIMQVTFWAGTAFGPLIFGSMADVLGRRPVVMILYSMAAITGILTCFVSDELSIFAVRFLAGIPFCVMCSTTYILVLEYVGPYKRKFVTLLFTMTYSISWIFLPLIAYLMGTWKLFMITVSPLLFVIAAMTWFLPESLSWQIVKKKSESAIKNAKHIAQINGRTLSNDFLEKFEESINTVCTVKYSVKDLFRTKSMRKLVFLNACAWITVCCGYTGGIYATVSLSHNPFMSIFLGSLFETLAPILQFIFIDKIGRRWTCSFSSMLCVLCWLLSCCFINGNYWAFISLAIAGRVFATTTFNTTGQFCAELLPIGIRARGIAFRQIIGTAGTFLSSYVIYLRINEIYFPQKNYNKAIPLITMSIIMAFGALIFLLLPETMDKKLTTHVSDVDELFEEHKFWSFPWIKKHREQKEVEEKEEDLEKKAMIV
ncbi:Solute carrier family 22 member 1 [Nymphon striatum]|nr:Solute carrier family 22 member 1 [Nymphon striatum]